MDANRQRRWDPQGARRLGARRYRHLLNLFRVTLQSERSCNSRPSGVNVSERVVRVKSDPPKCCSSRCTLLRTAEGEIDSEWAAAV